MIPIDLMKLIFRPVNLFEFKSVFWVSSFQMTLFEAKFCSSIWPYLIWIIQYEWISVKFACLRATEKKMPVKQKVIKNVRIYFLHERIN